MASLAFIDTNIYLGFYRYGNDVSLSLLRHIYDNHNRIITTAEVEMEYKKNRQGIILQALASIKPQNTGGLNIPSFLKESQYRHTYTRTQKRMDNLTSKLRDRTAKLLESPNLNDPVYKVLQRLFKAKEPCHLTRDRKIRFEIRELAQKRFMLGYPPRKPSDTSLGDAINWEWIIYCAKNCSDDIVIISRDTDYGVHHKDNSFLNDWLFQEFKERVSRRRAITFTRSLAEGFKLAGISVSLEEERAEETFLRNYESVRDNLRNITDAIRAPIGTIKLADLGTIGTISISDALRNIFVHDISENENHFTKDEQDSPDSNQASQENK